MRAILAFGAIVVSTAASAQLGQNQSSGPDNGFFRPTPGNDPSVHAPVAAPAVQPVVVAPPQQPVPVAAPVYVPPVQPATPEEIQRQMREAERELDRAQREAADEQQKAKQQPAPINGAFTGNTDPRNR